MKKIISALLSGLMLISCTAAFADEPEAIAEEAVYTEEATLDAATLAAEAQAAIADGTAETATVIVNGKVMEFDMAPIILHGRTMVPMRAIFEELGATVNWYEDDQMIVAIRNASTVSASITMHIGSTSMSFIDINHFIFKDINFDVPPFLLPLPDGNGDRTLVPVRVISETFGAKVKWDEASSTVTINL